MKIRNNIKKIKVTVGCLLGCFILSCQMNVAHRDFELAEDLWLEKKYQKATDVFISIYEKNPNNKTGIKALLRAATTEALFLNKHSSAIDKLNIVIEKSNNDETKNYVYLKIGDILYLQLKDYKKTFNHYNKVINKLTGKEKETAYYRMGKSLFYLMNFSRAYGVFKKLVHEFPNKETSEKAYYEMGLTLFSLASELKEKHEKENIKVFNQAISSFKDFIKQYPKSKKIPEAYFGIASSYEELGNLPKARDLFIKIKKEYPSRQVISIKLDRIQERMKSLN